MLPLLRTKTIIPPVRPKRVERTRLMHQLQQGVLRALTLVVAPAGFGKTTLVAEWARTCELPIAWLSLQPADRSRERFLAYIIQSLQSIEPQLGQTSLALIQGGSPEGALFSLVNDLSEINADFALILDDYHSVENLETDDILDFLLKNRPANFHLVLASRATPNLNLSRLRALDQIAEITTADLRFNEPEVRAFFEVSMDLPLPAEAITSLNQTTEGWAVGMQLAALALVRQPDNWTNLAGQEHIFDYLAEEVLRRETLEVQAFLTTSALFDRFCTPLCEHLIHNNQKNAGVILDHIERANLFLVPLGSEWYRYHALFTDFLRRQVNPEQAGALYRIASDWFEQNGLLDDAIHYAVHAADYERAASLLENHYRDMLQRGEQAALKEWIESMPPELLHNHPRLWLALGWVCIIGLDSTRAQEYAAKAEALLPAGPPGDHLRGEAKSLHILGGIFAGEVAAAEEISEAFVLLAEQDDFLHCLLHFNLGLHHVMRGETTPAIDAFSETLRLTTAFKLPLVAIFAQVQLGEVRHMRGALGLAERTFQQVIRYAEETLGEHTFLLGMPYISYADLLREQNRFDEAIMYAEQGLAYCHIWQPVVSMDGHIALSRLLAAGGRWDEAQVQLESAMLEAENSASVLDDTFIAIQLARLALVRADLPRASQIILQYDLEKASAGMYYHLWEMTWLLLYRLKVSRLAYDPSPASELIEQISILLAEAERRERVTPAIEALLLRAYALHSTGRHPEAAEDLTHALSLGAQGGYVRIFADEGRQLLHLLEQYRARIHAPHTYLNQILDLIRVEANQLRQTNKPPLTKGKPVNLPNLTRRELDILQLMATGKSNQEIANEHVLALNTVKKHVNNILTKMGVANRTQAVVLARKMGWIE